MHLLILDCCRAHVIGYTSTAILKVFKAILIMHVVYLPSCPCQVVTVLHVLCLVVLAASTGGSNQGGSCVQSYFNQPLTKHVGICRQEKPL